MTLASKITLIRIAFIPIYMVFMYLSAGVPGLWMWLALGIHHRKPDGLSGRPDRP